MGATLVAILMTLCSTSKSTKLWFGCWRVSCRFYALHCRRDEAGSPQTPTKVQALAGPVTCLRHGDWGRNISIRSASSKLPQVSLYEAQLVPVRLRRDQLRWRSSVNIRAIRHMNDWLAAALLSEGALQRWWWTRCSAPCGRSLTSGVSPDLRFWAYRNILIDANYDLRKSAINSAYIILSVRE